MEILKLVLLALILIVGILFCYVHLAEKRSLASWIIERIFWITNMKEKLGDAKPEMEKAAKISAKPFPNPEKYVGQPVTEVFYDGMQTFVWNNKNNKDQKALLYIHGGAYISQPTANHFKAVAKMAKDLDAKVIFPIYPKAPDHIFKETFPKLDILYKDLLNTVNSSKQITFMGDSAGGGLALGFAMYARDHKLPQPKDIILLSPWLDLETNNPEMAKIDPVDPMLLESGLYQDGLAWAGNKASMKNPYVSPIYGDLRELGKISMFVGTHEIFLADNEKLHHMLEKQGIKHNLFVANKMGHVYVIYPIPEAKRAQKKIVEIINSKN